MQESQSDDDITLDQAINRLESKRSAIHERLKRNMEIEPIDDRGVLVGPCDQCVCCCFDPSCPEDHAKPLDQSLFDEIDKLLDDADRAKQAATCD